MLLLHRLPGAISTCELNSQVSNNHIVLSNAKPLHDCDVAFTTAAVSYCMIVQVLWA
jgi:hypothetical protein